MKKVVIFIIAFLICISDHSYGAVGDVINSFVAPGGFVTGGSRGLAWDGQYLWNSDAALDMIYQINPLNGSVVNSFPTPNINSGDLTFVGNELWNVDIFPRTFYSGNTTTGAPWTAEFSKPGYDYMGLAYDGTNLWAADFNYGTIDKLDLAGNVLESYPSPDIGPTGLEWDGTNLWVSDANTDRIYKVDPTNGNVLLSFPTPGPDPAGLAFDGQYLWVTDTLTNEIYQMDIGYTPAPPGAVTLLTMLGGMGGWAGAGRIIRHRKKEPKKNKAA